MSFTQPLTRPRVAKRVFSRNSKSAAVRASGATDDGKTGWVFAGKLPMLPPAGPVLALPGSTETGAPKFMNAKEAFNFSLGAALGRPAPIPEPTEEVRERSCLGVCSCDFGAVQKQSAVFSGQVTLPISASPRRTMRVRSGSNAQSELAAAPAHEIAPRSTL